MKAAKKIYGEIKKVLKSNRSGFISKLKNEIPHWHTVFDIGSYTGKVIDEISKINGDIQFHAFEPFSGSFKKLESKFCASKKIILNQCAVSDKPGRLSFQVNAFKETNSLLEPASVDTRIDAYTKKETTEEVAVITIDEYCLTKNITSVDFIKIDTQGNSYQVLTGMKNLLERKAVKYLYVEAEFMEMYKGEKLFSEIESYLRGQGYFLMGLYNLNEVGNRLGWCDALFTCEAAKTS